MTVSPCNMFWCNWVFLFLSYGLMYIMYYVNAFLHRCTSTRNISIRSSAVTYWINRLRKRNSWHFKRSLSVNVEQVTTWQVLSPFTISLQLPSVSGTHWLGIKHTHTQPGLPPTTAYCLPITSKRKNIQNGQIYEDIFIWHLKNVFICLAWFFREGPWLVQE